MVADLAARIERLDTLFGVELGDRVNSLNALLLHLEQGGHSGALASLGREMHSLKGAARAVGATGVEHLAHAAESAVAAVPAHQPPSREWLDALFAAVDALASLHDDPHADTSAARAALAAVTTSTPAAEPIPISALRAASSSVPAEAAPPASTGAAAPPEQNSVRVALTKLDTLLTESGELSVTQLRIAERLTELRNLQRQVERWQRDWTRSRPARARLRRATAHGPARDAEALLRAADRSDEHVQAILQQTRELVADLTQNTSQLAAVSDAIGREVLSVRLLPAATVFLPFERLVRDLSRQMDKDVRLLLSGTDTEVDRRILDVLRDPLLHMVRNSIDHGLEAADERVQAGKAPQGTLRLAAAQRGDRVQITVEDDGRGLDLEGIRETAIRRNLVPADRAAQMDATTLVDLIFEPGFSTRQVVSETSGRGVGMDVVRDHVTRLGGDVSVRSTPGVGTCFTINVPLTLATTRVLLVEDAGQMFAVPSSTIERTGRVRPGELRALEGRLALQVDGRPLPVVELADLLQRPSAEAAERGADDWRPFFVLAQGERAVAVMTDRLVDETELVVKALGAPLVRVRHVGGAAVLGSGAVVVILNPTDLSKSALGTTARPRRAALDGGGATPAARRRILVVDDSVMTRTLERTILESAGYAVAVAGDGEQALHVLEGDQQIDAIVSDVEMPRMDGLALTAAVRQDERWRHLPIVLVTSLDSAEHVERGAAAGADAYIVKGRFDQQDLLQTVGRLL